MKGPGILLSEPLSSGSRCEVKYPRATHSDYQNLSSSYLLNLAQRTYQRQFFHIYNVRLNTMRKMIETSVRRSLGQKVLIKNLCDLDALAEAEDSEEAASSSDVTKVVIIGTIFKNQPLKPSILKEIAEDQGLHPQPPAKRYISAEDEIILEDSNARIKLIFDDAMKAKGFTADSFATGVIAGVYGNEIRTGKGKGTTGGKFHVEQVFFADALPPPSTEFVPKEDRYIVIASGLELSSQAGEALAALELAVSWIVGDAGEMADQNFNSNIERIILAGNSLSEETRNREAVTRAKYLTKDEDAASVIGVNSLDEILASLCVSLDVDLMPGEFDPANQILPQQPLHRCLFPRASAYPTLQTVTNPYKFNIAGRLIVGTSGQNIDDVIRNTDIASSVDAMESILRWSHLAPTCPDTLGCFPFEETDPFVLDQRPNIFFAANQDKFERREVSHPDGSSTVLLSIPRFAETSEVCLINLTSLETQLISFAPIN